VIKTLSIFLHHWKIMLHYYVEMCWLSIWKKWILGPFLPTHQAWVDFPVTVWNIVWIQPIFLKATISL